MNRESARHAANWSALPAALFLSVSLGSAAAQTASDPTSPQDTAQHRETQPVLDRYDWQAWTTQDGLPQNSVSDIVQTRDGYLWLATFGGLARFDGVRFKVFDLSNTEALHSNRILSLLEDRSGNLWIGTQQGGVVRLRDGVFTSFLDAENAPSGEVWSIVEDRHGVVFFGGSHLVRYQGGRFESAGTDEWMTSVRQVWSLFVDREQSLWVATNGGLGRFRDGQWRVFRITDGLPTDDVRFVHEDSRGLLWVSTADRLYYLDGERFVESLVQGERPGWIFAAAVDGGGNYWVGSDEGLFLPRAVRESGNGSSDRTLWHRAIERSAAGRVRALLEDREGNIWVGTDGDGLIRVRGAPLTAFVSPPGVDEVSRAKSLAGDDGGGLWIQFSGSRIGHLKDGEWTELPASDDIGNIRFITTSGDGTLWIWHQQQTRLSKYRDGQFTHLELDFKSISGRLVDRSGTVWILSAGRLLIIRDGQSEPITVADGLPTIGGGLMADSRDGTIWIGANGALIGYREGEFRHYTAADGMPRGQVRSIHDGSDGNLWIATYGGGMARLRDGEFTRYTTREGLPDNSLGKILEDDGGNLWVNSNHGVFRVSLDELNGFADGRLSKINCRTFRTGEASGESGARTTDGRLWFPTTEGLITIETEVVVANEVPPPVVIEAAHIADQTFGPADRIELPMDHRDVAIEYTGLSFVDPGDVTFRYRLIGYNENWLDAGTRRVAHYTNLPPGSYEFHVQARNNDRVWSEHAATLGITVPPHFYETAWFFALCGLGVIATGFVGYRVRTRNMRVRNAALRQSEQRYRRVVEDQSEFIVRWLPDGTRTFVNGAYCRHFGLTQDEAIGTSFFPLIAEEDRAGIRGKIDSLTPENPAATTEHRVIRPDGAIGWQQWTDGAIFDSDGEMIELQSVGRDVTERKRTETVLRRLVEVTSHRFGKSLLESMALELARTLEADYAFIGELEQEKKESIRSIAFVADGRLMPAAEYDLAGTPCQNVVQKSVCSYPSGVAEQFPTDTVLKEMGVQGYVGVPLIDSQHTVLGIVSALFRKPVEKVDFTESILQIYSSRVGSELERLRADKALIESEERYRAVAEDTPVLICRFLPGGEITYVNDAYCRYFEKKLAELVGQTFLSLIPESDRETVMANISALTVESPTQSLEHKVIAPGNEIRWQRWTNRAVFDAEGKAVAYQAVGEDITDRKRVEEALQRSEERLNLAVRGASDGMWDWSLETGEEHWSPRFKELLGYGENEIEATYDRFLTFLHPDDKARVLEAVRRHLEENQPYDCEFRMQTKSGQYRWFQSRGEALRDKHGRPYRMAGSVRDITDRRKTEEALQESGERLRLMMQESPSAIEVYDVDGVQVDVNKAYESLWGFPAEHTVGQFNVLESQQVEATGLLKYVKRAYAGETVKVPEYEFDSRGATEGRGIGRIRWLNTRIYPLKDIEGTVHHIVITHEDITERKRAEKKRLELEVQLRESHKMEAVGQLSAGVAHDFNNLLTVILCNSEMLLSALAQEAAAPFEKLLRSGLDLIQTAGKQAAFLTRQLLTFGRRETAEPEMFDPTKIVGDVEVMLRRMIGEHIQLDFRLNEATWSVLAAPGQIEQVIMNLVLNAADAMPKGGVVEIRVENVELDRSRSTDHTDAKPGPHVMLSVTDTGTGMTPETLEHLFEPFFTTKPVGKGTGLGLATVYGVAKQLGGHIIVDSKLGVGSTLRVYLPVLKQKEAEGDGNGDEKRLVSGEGETIVL